jgi:hypothetical protein
MSEITHWKKVPRPLENAGLGLCLKKWPQPSNTRSLKPQGPYFRILRYCHRQYESPSRRMKGEEPTTQFLSPIQDNNEDCSEGCPNADAQNSWFQG